MADDIYSDEVEEKPPLVTWRPDVLVVGPGGVKGLVHLGALFYMEQADILSAVHTYCGVSVGAIITLMLSIGCSVNEIIAAAVSDNFFSDVGSFRLEAAMDKKGLLSIEPLRKKISSIVAAKYNGNIPTLAELYTATGKTYEAVAVNLTTAKVEYLSWLTHPGMPCVTAAILSASLPGVFQVTTYNECCYSDGGIGDPYPINRYDNSRNRILGMYIESVVDPVSLHSPWSSYIARLVNIPLRELRRKNIADSTKNCKHLCLTTVYTGTVGVHISPQERAALIVEGYQHGRAFVSTQRTTPVISKRSLAEAAILREALVPKPIAHILSSEMLHDLQVFVGEGSPAPV